MRAPSDSITCIGAGYGLAACTVDAAKTRAKAGPNIRLIFIRGYSWCVKPTDPDCFAAWPGITLPGVTRQVGHRRYKTRWWAWLVSPTDGQHPWSGPVGRFEAVILTFLSNGQYPPRTHPGSQKQIQHR